MIRPGLPSDHNFIVDSWVGSYGESAIAASMRQGLYRSRWPKLASHLVRTQHVLVACDDASPNVILAWVCHDGAGALHYLFTRDDFRHQGHARALVQAIRSRIDTYTARTTLWQRAAPAFARTWTYDPARAWFPALVTAQSPARPEDTTWPATSPTNPPSARSARSSVTPG